MLACSGVNSARAASMALEGSGATDGGVGFGTGMDITGAGSGVGIFRLTGNPSEREHFLFTLHRISYLTLMLKRLSSVWRLHRRWKALTSHH